MSAASEVGYRHIDTAEMYGNEKEVGQGIRDAGLDRGESLSPASSTTGLTGPTTRGARSTATLSALGSEYVDLFLIHWPLPTLYDGDFVSTWNVLEEFAGDGRARSIGVSNFQVGASRPARRRSPRPSPRSTRSRSTPTSATNRSAPTTDKHGIATEAWSPIAQGKVLDDPVIAGIADAHGKTPAQVVLRWHIQRGDIVFPKSVRRERMKSNFDIFDFSLDSDEMDAITGLDRGESGRTGPNPDKFDYIPD